MITAIKSAAAAFDRLAGRRAIREQIAENKLQLRRLAENKTALDALDARADAAAARHSQTCGPLQNELSKIEARIVAAMADDRAEKPADAIRRVEILEAISAANEALQSEIQLVEKLRLPLQRERNLLAKLPAELSGLQNRLTHDPLAKPEWVDEFRALEICDLAFEQILGSVRRSAADAATQLTDAKQSGQQHDLVALTRQAKRWQIALGRFKQHQAEVTQRRAELRAEMLDE